MMTFSIEPFVFKSKQHQRFQNGAKVGELQICNRTVIVEKNTCGCPGYMLEPGDGYIVRLFNDDSGKPQMANKPMRIYEQTEKIAEFKGYVVDAQSPFGWQEIDLSDYGLTVYYENNIVSKCVLHMFDRDTHIEYYGEVNSQEKTIDIELTTAEKYANSAIKELKLGNDGDSVYHQLYLAWREFRSNPSVLKHIKDYALFGSAMSTFLSYGTIGDIDIRQQIASVSYFFLSKAIKESHNPNYVKNRLLLMKSNREELSYTVQSVLGCSFMDIVPPWMKARDAMYKMTYADMCVDERICSFVGMNREKIDIENKIKENFFGTNKTKETIINEGIQLHDSLFKYLKQRLLFEEDIDF